MNLLPMTERFVKFAGNTLRFRIHHPEILSAVDTHFEHCLGKDERIVAEYQVMAEKEAFSILRDGKPIRICIALQQVMFHLMQDGLMQLNGASSTYLVFHAAALAHQERGLLFCGKSGSGKSTLAAWLTASGFQYLTDEVIAYPLVGGEVSGFCRSLVLKHGAHDVWERWLPRTTSINVLKMNDGSVWIAPTLLNSSAVRERVEPQIIFFPTYSAGAEFKAEQLTSAGALFQLMQCLVDARNFSDHGIGATKRLAQKTSAYRFTYSDVEQASEWIQEKLTT